ncbi:hypothetical protein PR048_026062 [Dryococelus australis]|uniref:Uncharacterized protein n=1 Tax=Dryococelus australis TaxID=614101 RepID=A0ABQ9GKB0_9NEOP|nr:hypothetical protein PR048_026062 [Dryococelus australis]
MYCEDLKYLKHVIAYSDCCDCQNRNKNIMKYWMMMVKQTPIEVIDHKFLEPGHTYIECDKDFGLIEKCKKFLNNVYVPSVWMATVKQKSKQFYVVPMTKEDFLSIDALQKYTKISAHRDDDVEAIAWRTIRWRCIGRPGLIALQQLYPQGVEIKDAKFKNLQELKPLIPPVHHTFFDSLNLEPIPCTSAQEGNPLEESNDEDSALSSDGEL